VHTKFGKKGNGSLLTSTGVWGQATAINLLEVMLYHAHGAEAMGEEALIELVDYCAKKAALLNGGRLQR
jgi:hypothetical protein